MPNDMPPPEDPPALAPPRRIGILGAGRAGTALARVAASSGIEVDIAASRPPRLLKYHLAQYAPQARAVDAGSIADHAQLVVLMVPQEDLDEIDPATLAGITVVDATNRWQDEPIPSWLEAALSEQQSSSEAIAAHFGQARVVKALNHISHWDLDSAGRRSASPRRGLAIASDHTRDAAQVAALIDALGYDPVLLGSLAAGRMLEPGSDVFNQVLTADELRRSLCS